MREVRLRLSALQGLVRPFTLLAPVVGVISGAVVGAEATSVALPFPALLYGVLSAAAATGASNAWNQVFDLEIDRRNKPARPLPAGRVTRGAALTVGNVLALAAILLGVLTTPFFLACVAIGLVATWTYSAPPLRLKRSTLGALLAIAVPRGLLVPVAGWGVVAEPLRADPWALGIVAGLFVLGAAATKDFADAPGDADHGCRTLPVVLGARRAARVVAPFLVLPFLLYPLFGALGWIDVPVARLLGLSAALAVLGAFTARALLADPDGLAAAGERGHPAWRGMYALLLGTQVGTALVYAL